MLHTENVGVAWGRGYEMLLEKLAEVGLDPKSYEIHSLQAVMPLWLLIQEFQTDFLSDMVAGKVRMPTMACKRPSY